jgi:hypothetical protein
MKTKIKSFSEHGISLLEGEIAHFLEQNQKIKLVFVAISCRYESDFIPGERHYALLIYEEDE